MVVTNRGESEFKERLISAVKKEVKILMEEAVTKKCIHEESSSVIQLCAAVEACLSQGLRRRALGLFKTSSTTALLQKVGKNCTEAEYISKKVHEIETADFSKRFSWSSDSTNKPPMFKKGSSNSVTTMSVPSSTTSSSVKYLWIRLALYEKCLAKIIEHLATNATSYYDRDALVADPDYGSILSSLLVGPCALEFVQAKTPNQTWSDPHADELVQRHRISIGRRSSSTCQRSIINFKRSLNAVSDDANNCSFKSMTSTTVAKDYVESLHQNSSAALMYGKNNVQVIPKDFTEPMAGYLSLHQHVQSLTIKWTPNQLMNGYADDHEDIDKSEFWAYVLNINVDEIVYVHCHQSRGDDTGGTIILVGQDGVQRPPIHFPEGGHMQTFLSRLETGLLPHGQLDPPLWSQRGIGRMFPWPKNVRRRILSSVMESVDETPIDYVFRIVSKSQHEEFVATHSILDLVKSSPRRAQLGSCSTTGSSDFSSKSISIDQGPLESPLIQAGYQSESIELVCSTMRRQIISRSFYGWLAYCRHLSTVRTHLSGLVDGRITPELKADEEGLTKEKWEELQEDGVISKEAEFYRLVYFGGIQPEIRKEVWPFLLGHYSFGMTPEERQTYDETSKHYYETTMSEWLAVEAIVQQREKEKTARTKLSSGSTSGYDKPLKQPVNLDSEEENDVFEENDFSDMSDPEEFEEERRESEVDAPQAGGLLTKPLSRTKKTSTDSGNVDEDDIEIDHNTNLPLEEQCFSDNIGDKSKGETSSYATVGNEFADSVDFHSLNISAAVECGNKEREEAFKIPKFHIVVDEHQGQTTEANDGPCSLEIQQHMESASEPSNSSRQAAFIITDASVDVANLAACELPENADAVAAVSMDVLQEPKSACVSPASSIGGVYSSELLKDFEDNLDRIEKDVHRCDRNYWYFANENLDKLRNVITTYVWEHLDVGYMQGMCDLVAPLLVIFDDESLSYGCFCKLMERMIENFPKGGAMDMHFANMRSLIQILDSEMYDLMDSHGDYTHFYFCYRWFLLDFKREFIYDDVFSIWESIWAAKHVASGQFVLFLALALLETYRDVILSNSMDFTDVIKFFNEMAERHNCPAVLQLARSLVLQLQMIIENK